MEHIKIITTLINICIFSNIYYMVLNKNILNFFFQIKQLAGSSSSGAAAAEEEEMRRQQEAEERRRQKEEEEEEKKRQDEASAAEARRIRIKELRDLISETNFVKINRNLIVDFEVDRYNIMQSFLDNITDLRKPILTSENYNVRFKGESGYGNGIREIFNTLMSNSLHTPQNVTQIPYFLLKNNYLHFNPDNTHWKGFEILGQFFAHSLITNKQLNARLHPIILYCLTHTKCGVEGDILNRYDHLFYKKIIDIFKGRITKKKKNQLELLHSANTKMIKKYNIQDLDNRVDSDFFNNWETVRDVMESYEPGSFENDVPRYLWGLTDNPNEWLSDPMTKLCFESPNFMCEDPTYLSSRRERDRDISAGVDHDREKAIQVAFIHRNFLINFNVLTVLIYSSHRQLTHFLNGFFSLTHPDFMRQISMNELNELIVGKEFVNIDEFLDLIKIVGPNTDAGLIDNKNKNQIETEIRDIIRQYAIEDDKYLNEMVYLISGRRNLPFPSVARPTLSFNIVRMGIESHTCFLSVDFPKYVNTETIKLNLQKETLIAASNARVQDGGSYREKYIKYKNKYMELKNKIV